jgi:hypothetical protein
VLPILDFGFSANIGRSISYAMGGATELKMTGVAPAGATGAPNYPLLRQLLHSTRLLYRYISALALVLFGIVGTIVVALRVHQTASPTTTWIAWAITLASIVWEIYSGWWATFVRGMNAVVQSARIAVFAYAINLCLAAILLWAGAGLMAVPIATLISTFLQRSWMRRVCLQILPQHDAHVEKSDVYAIIKLLWPNTWRLGLQLLTAYIASNLIIFLKGFDLADNAQYGLSVRVISMIQGMSVAWVLVKWPAIGQFRAQHDYASLRKLIRSRIWLQGLSFVALAVFLVTFGQPALEWFGSKKQILPRLWLSLLALNVFLEMRFTFWGTLIFTENKMPYVWPAIVTNICGALLILALLHWTMLGFGALVIGPLIAGCTFNYWYWPVYGARTIRTTWFRFVFFGKANPESTQASVAH